MRIPVIGSALLVTAVAIGCSPKTEGPVQTTSDKSKASVAVSEDEARREGNAQVRVIQAIPEAPSADIFTGDQKTFSGVSFGTVTPYKPVKEEHFTIALKPANQPDAATMIEAKEGVDAGRRYTILAETDRNGAAKLDVVSDDEPAPAPGKAKVRVIHVAPGAGSVSIYSQGDKKNAVVDNVDFGSPASYREVDPAAVTIEVAAKGDKPAKGALITEQAKLEAGKLYTMVVVSGEKAGKAADVLKIEDQVGPANASNAAVGSQSDATGGTKATGKSDAIQREDYDSPDYEIHPDADSQRDRAKDQKDQKDQPKDQARKK